VNLVSRTLVCLLRHQSIRVTIAGKQVTAYPKPKHSVSQKSSQVRTYPRPETRSARKSGRSHVQPGCFAVEVLKAAVEQLLRVMGINGPRSLSAASIALLAAATLPSTQKRSCGQPDANTELSAGRSPESRSAAARAAGIPQQSTQAGGKASDAPPAQPHAHRDRGRLIALLRTGV